MGKAAYRRSLEVELPQLRRKLDLLRRRIPQAHGSEKLIRTAEWMELDKRYLDIIERLRLLGASGDGIAADVSAELDRMVNGLADGLDDWTLHVDEKYLGRSALDISGD